MNLMHLKYAVEVAKKGSVNKAADDLLMAQSNLSRAIKELEASLGITIFDRSSKGMVVTHEGEEFLGYATKILGQVEELENLYKNGIALPRSFSISVPRACYISEAFVRFSKKIGNNPAEIFYKETNALKTINNITQKDYKLGIIRYAQNYDKYFTEMLEEKELVHEKITDFKYELIMSKNSPLALVDEISFEDLKPYIEIAHADPFVPSLSVSKVRKEELPNNAERCIFVYERASQFELLSENAETYMWVSPVPKKLLDSYGLVQRSCSENKKMYKDVLIYRKNYKLTELDNLFISELCESKRKYL